MYTYVLTISDYLVFIPAVNDWLNVISEHVDIQLPCIMDCVMLQYKVVSSVVTRVWGLIIRKPLSITGYWPSAYASSLRKTFVWNDVTKYILKSHCK